MSIEPQEIERRKSASALCRMLEEVKALLRTSDCLFKDEEKVAVLTEDDGDIDTMIAQAIGSLGLCATVMLTDAKNTSKNMPGPVFGNSSLIVEIAENTTTNRTDSGTQITCLEAAEEAARYLHQARCASGRMILVDSIRKYAQPPPPANVCYHVLCTTGDVQIIKRS
jgi:hypothetical protein